MDEPNTGRELVSGKAMVDRPRLHINKLNWVSLWKPFPTGGGGSGVSAILTLPSHCVTNY